MTEYNIDPKLCWIETYTGKHIYPYDPKAEDVDIRDIAHSLSLICRYSGHCKEFYSVAQHSVLVMHNVSKENKLAALLHDASEAYLGDLARPIKFGMPYYKKIEGELLSVIYEKFGVNNKHCDKVEIKKADDVVLMTEARDLMFNTHGWDKPQKPLTNMIVKPWTPKKAERMFLHYFYKLTKNS